MVDLTKQDKMKYQEQTETSPAFIFNIAQTLYKPGFYIIYWHTE